MADKAPKLELITSEVDPDLTEVKRFIKARIAEGAIAVLIAAILALLARMRDLNTELHRRLEASRRKRPPSETLHRLQMELPFWGKKPDNDTAEDASAQAAEKPKKERKKRFMHDPVMELTNNDVERGLRTWVLDRKTWMFCGHAQSARRAADALTIITTCKNLDIDPRCYIRDTLRRILDGEKDLNALLPENYKPRAAETAPHEASVQRAAA